MWHDETHRILGHDGQPATRPAQVSCSKEPASSSRLVLAARAIFGGSSECELLNDGYLFDLQSNTIKIILGKSSDVYFNAIS